jgi:hypothetical protein
MSKKEATVNEIMNLKKSKVGHASHVPLLVNLAFMFNIETVVEIGSGPISTRLFLDKRYFRELDSIISYEHREGWYKKVKSLIGDDWRLDYRLLVNDTDDFDLKQSGDLLFLDGLKRHRIYCAKKMSKNFKFIVIHDKDITGIEYKYKWVYKPKSQPVTAIMSNVVDVSRVKWQCVWDKKLITELCKL